ncbi:hypothetical protein IY145_03055 [Methylosinus sp. H3A]|uniref:hypothetical protein n=1 Tax=Methylosinus sp. H3A TaxID=2785786 RepID=UPI0018C1ED0F|nr:hypothetical protein [Methylosinus sp. H3A]MBG0808352.1 hypothetical protein [Methylosinus sp. H3A]
MGDTRDGAAGSLAQIAIVERRTRAALAYRRAGAFLILWGVLVAVGAGISPAHPDQTEAIWYGVDAAGLLGTAAITLYRRRIGTFDARAGGPSSVFSFWAPMASHGHIFWHRPAMIASRSFGRR